MTFYRSPKRLTVLPVRGRFSRRGTGRAPRPLLPWAKSRPNRWPSIDKTGTGISEIAPITDMLGNAKIDAKDPCQTSKTMKGLRQKRPPVLPSSRTSQWLHAPTEKNWKLSGNDSVNRRTRSPSLNDEAIAVSPTRDLHAPSLTASDGLAL